MNTRKVDDKKVYDNMCWLRTSLEIAASFEDNWDGLGSFAAEPGALESALELLPRYIPADPCPVNVMPPGNGGIMLKWLIPGGIGKVCIFADRSDKVTLVNLSDDTVIRGSLEEYGHLVRQSMTETDSKC